MPKVIIEIEDRESGGVAVRCNPPVADLLQKHYNTVDGLTSAEAYAVHMLNNLRDTSVAQEQAASPLAIPGMKSLHQS